LLANVSEMLSFLVVERSIIISDKNLW